jgi:precorrin-6B methylase 2
VAIHIGKKFKKEIRIYAIEKRDERIDRYQRNEEKAKKRNLTQK